MIQSPICYQSKQVQVYIPSASPLDESNINGIKCSWRGCNTNAEANLIWKFDWGELWGQGVDRLTGYITIKVRSMWIPPPPPIKIEVDWTEADQNISEHIGGDAWENRMSFEYSFTPHCAPTKKVLYDELFASSDMNDMVLVIEGKRIPVNKAFLSIHSEYFKVLFSNNFKEGSLSEIKINDISYDDFGLLCSSFYPNPEFPNDRTVEKLLMMARRFLVSSVTAIVEHHLLHISKIREEKMIWLADEFRLPKLLEKCIRRMDSLEKAKKLENSEEFEKLSDNTRMVILGRISEFPSLM